MLAQTTGAMSDSFPPCLSNYGGEDTRRQSHAPLHRAHRVSVDQQRSHPFPLFAGKEIDGTAPSLSRSIPRRNSANSGLSYSTGSSPTTTSSTFDSPLVTEMPGSPSSSPESATSTVPPQSFQSSLRPFDTPSLPHHSIPVDRPLASPPPGEESKRNVKGLTLDMKLPALLRPMTSAGLDGSFPTGTAPTSPLKEPPRTGRKKPTNLTIRTPSFNQVSFPRLGEVPPTPSQRTGISLAAPLSPSLSKLASPTLGPVGGMHLALPNIAQHFPRDSISSASGSSFSVGSSLPHVREDEYEPPRSQETPERGYTDGPVQIYDAGVYLYLEPTAEEASQFDTVINCAKEIRDPFAPASTAETVVSVWRHAAAVRDAIEPQTAVSEVSFKSAAEWPPTHDAATPTPTPTTPKARRTAPTARPEYLHVPWDHNSEILADLWSLCQVIDDRVRHGKKVLIHCQLGVSRSASLIIAYGLYKGFETDFHSMYMAVKQRSRWVGPNMSLIYQLTDFRAKVARGDYAAHSQPADPTWFLHSAVPAPAPVTGPGRSSTTVPERPRPRDSNPSLAAASAAAEKPPLRLNKQLPPVPALPKRGLLPDPSIPPPRRLSFQPASEQRSISAPLDSGVTVRRTASRPVGMRPRNHITSQLFIPPHRPTSLRPLKILPPTAMMDLARQDVPASPSIFSPRATEFVASPFGVTTAGDLATSAPKRIRPPPGAFPGGAEWRQSLRQSMDLSQDIAKLLSNDPRSPHQSGEIKAIIRSIDDVL